MADINDRLPRNAEGRFYVDSSCIDCDKCRGLAADFFRRDDDTGYSYVHHQPSTAEDLALCIEAMEECPTQSIGG